MNRGVTDVDDMRRHLREFVRIEIFPGREMPPPTSRQYFPTKKDIYNHMYRAMVKSRFSNCDQTNAEEKVKEWQTQTPNDKFFFRKYSDICDAKFENDVVSNSSNGEDLNDEDIRVTSPLSYQKFLFVHQTTWQRRLLSKYGNDICLLDATYKTTRYALPLFFLAVKTNVDYQVVASFVLQDESTDSIKEALQVIKDWNPDWQPSFFMSDFREIHAVEETFPGTTKLSIFHLSCVIYVFYTERK